MVESTSEVEIPAIKKEDRWGWGKKEWKRLLLFSILFLFMAFGTYFVSMSQEKETVDLFEKVSTVMLENLDIEEGSATGTTENDKSAGFSWKQTFLLFVNNVTVMFVLILGAAITAYFYPTVVIASNGVMMGLVLAAIGIMEPATNLFLLIVSGILPHGIFEIPALLISAVIGVRWGVSGYRALGKREQDYPYKTVTKQTVRVFAFVLVPLLGIAAVVEGFVTPLLMAQ